MEPVRNATDLQDAELVRSAARRGLSRRSLAKLFALATAGATLPFTHEAALAQLSNIGRLPPGAVKLNANEFPSGLTPAAMKRLVEVAQRGNLYQYEEMADFEQLVAQSAGVDPKAVAAYPGSSLALLHAVLAFVGPEAPLVTVSPGYEAAARGAEWVDAEAIRVPLLEDGAHDVREMVRLAKEKSAGLLYVCNPNNPTGSVTAREQIDWLIANKPAATKVLIDEAYIHFTDEKDCTDLVGRDDVLVLRTFSKIYGMAGLRAGFLLAHPDLRETVEQFKAGALPATAMAAAAEMLRDPDVLSERKTYARSIREDLCDFFDQQGFEYVPSQSFKVMVDTRQPVETVIAAMREHQVYVGRPWPEWPTHLRVSLGSPQAMTAFKKGFLAVSSGT